MYPWTTTKANHMYFMIFEPSTHCCIVRHSFINLCCVRGLNSLCDGYKLLNLPCVLNIPKAKRKKNNINEANHMTSVTCILVMPICFYISDVYCATFCIKNESIKNVSNNLCNEMTAASFPQTVQTLTEMKDAQKLLICSLAALNELLNCFKNKLQQNKRKLL